MSGSSVVVAVLLLLLEPTLRIVEVPEIEARVEVLVELDPEKPFLAVVLDPVRASPAGVVDFLAEDPSSLVGARGFEAAVEIHVAPFRADLLAVRLVGEGHVDLAVVVLVLLLAGALPVAEGDEDVLACRRGCCRPRSWLMTPPSNRLSKSKRPSPLVSSVSRTFWPSR